MDGGAQLLSVVIPAHDEARVVGRCLTQLRPLIEGGEAEVVLVANGCEDDTAAVARATPGVTVLELPAASKPAALNAGDSAATGFPRVYLDADVEISADALRALGAALDGDAALVGAPRVRFELDGRPWLVRAYFEIFARLPYVGSGLVGLGVYGLSRSGRDRFAQFPALTADDLFVQRHFAPGERRVLPDHTFAVQVPHSLTGLLAVRTRAARGAAELASVSQTGTTATSSARALAGLVRSEPRLLPAAGVYLTVTITAKIRARRRRRRGHTDWERDDTTR